MMFRNIAWNISFNKKKTSFQFIIIYVYDFYFNFYCQFVKSVFKS